MITVKRANHDEMYDIQKNKTSQKVLFMSCFLVDCKEHSACYYHIFIVKRSEYTC